MTAQKLTEYPLLATRTEIILPRVVIPLEVGRSISLRAVDAALAGDGKIVVAAQRDPKVEAPEAADLYDVGVLCEITQVAKTSRTRYSIVLQSLERVAIDEVIGGSKLLVARTSELTAQVTDDEGALLALTETVRRHLIAVIADHSDDPDGVREVIDGLVEIDEVDELVDVAAAHLELDHELAAMLLVETDVARRLALIIPELERLEEVLRLKTNIEVEIEDRVSTETREKVLRARLRAIREELGEPDEEGEFESLRQKISDAEMPEEANEMALKMVRRLETTQPASQEHQIAQTYLGWLLDIPWSKQTDDTLDVSAARAILDADHAGLEKVKKRLLEFVAVRKLAPDKQSPILCLVGPPGTGKTSLGRSIASALGRKYARISLGGVRDEAEIRGHRRTYVGAIPGRIVSGLAKAESRNPVFVLDEIDKMASGMRGDPAAAMLEVLDPEQNNEFVDHYLEVPVDLRRVMFIATANQLDSIPGPLRDRMEVIHVPGYTAGEKLTIARDHLVPGQISEHGLEKGQAEITDAAVEEVIHHYTRESGVRNLEREIASLCRHAAVQIASGGEAPVVVGGDDVSGVLGPRKVFSEVAGSKPAVGVTTGLAWTPVGGQILFIEIRKMTGSGKLKVTGQLGDVMSESVQTAYSFVRSKADTIGLDLSELQKSDLHLHLPGGAIKKDGPSAGTAIAVALTSLFSGIPVRPDVAITGEVTLRGRVLEVGGIKEKVLAAHRAGIKIVCLPERNGKDLVDIPDSVKNDLDIRLVSRVEEVLSIALAQGEPASKAGTGGEGEGPLPEAPPPTPAGPPETILES